MDPATMAMLASMFGGSGGGDNSGGYGGGGGGFGGRSPLGMIFGGLFGHSDRPYKDAMKEYEKYGNKAAETQNPFLNMGKGAIPQFQEWLQGQKDPSGFINKLMGGYNESPWAKFEQEQALRRAGNAGSVGDTMAGGIGSTPMAQFEQQNARDISSQDMEKWLSHVLGINTQYGGGLQNEITGGQNAANSLTSMYGDMGNRMGEAAYGAATQKNKDRNSIWGGLFG